MARGRNAGGWSVAAAAALIGLAGCGNGDSAVATRDRSTDPGGAVLVGGTAGAGDDARPGTSPTVITANRSETVDAKVERLYARNGAAFGARSAREYLDRMQAFIHRPPGDVETVKRPNGDTLIYQASTNTFAVVAENGTPRTMFKPDDGVAYWAEQKERAPTFGQRRAPSSQQ